MSLDVHRNKLLQQACKVCILVTGSANSALCVAVAQQGVQGHMQDLPNLWLSAVLVQKHVPFFKSEARSRMGKLYVQGRINKC